MPHSKYLIISKTNFFRIFCITSVIILRALVIHLQTQQLYQKIVYKSLTCIGTVTDYTYQRYKNYPHVYSIKLDTIKWGEHNEKCSHNLTLALKNKLSYDIGDYIQVDNITCYAHKTPQRWWYLLRSNNLLSARVEESKLKLLYKPSWSFNRWLVIIRNHILEKLHNKLSPQAFALCATLFFGKHLGNPEIDNNFKELCNKWGVVHYLARSGLHVAILVLLWRIVLIVFPLPFVIKEFLLLFCVALYASLSWSSISFFRSSIMFALHQWCGIFLIPAHGLYIWILTAIIALLHSPFDLLALDFQLSFGLTGALLYYFSVQR